jgi:hypothetical protein
MGYWVGLRDGGGACPVSSWAADAGQLSQVVRVREEAGWARAEIQPNMA